MENKGFTLIELIITIALLAVILVISFVSINKVLEQGRVNDCNSLVGSIKSAVSEYVGDNRYNSIFVGDIRNHVENNTPYEMAADILVDNNYLGSPIKNPFDKEEINPRDISINVTFNSNYTVKEISIVRPAQLVECKKD